MNRCLYVNWWFSKCNGWSYYYIVSCKSNVEFDWPVCLPRRQRQFYPTGSPLTMGEGLGVFARTTWSWVWAPFWQHRRAAVLKATLKGSLPILHGRWAWELPNCARVVTLHTPAWNTWAPSWLKSCVLHWQIQSKRCNLYGPECFFFGIRWFSGLACFVSFVFYLLYLMAGVYHSVPRLDQRCTCRNATAPVQSESPNTVPRVRDKGGLQTLCMHRSKFQMGMDQYL